MKEMHKGDLRNPWGRYGCGFELSTLNSKKYTIQLLPVLPQDETPFLMMRCSKVNFHNAP